MPRGHVHTHDCGHFYHDGRWYFLPGHEHGPGCGHVFANRNWRLLPPREERTRAYVRRKATQAQEQAHSGN